MTEFAKIDNGVIGNFVCPKGKRDQFGEYKSMITLSKEVQSPENYMYVMNAISKESNAGIATTINLWHSDDESIMPHQIETNLEPQQLLSALWSAELITYDEMTKAYKDLELSPSSGISSRIDRKPSAQQSFMGFSL